MWMGDETALADDHSSAPILLHSIRSKRKRGSVMAKTIVKPKLDIVVTFQIDEEECLALDALAGYGADAVVTAFHEKIGKAYMGPHEQ